MLDAPKNTPTECSFCKKAPEQIRKLVAGPDVTICDECVEVCVEIIAGPSTSGVEGNQGVQAVNGPLLTSLCSLCRMPVVVEELMAVVGRGAICKPCVRAVQHAVNEESLSGPLEQ